jgi:hypothetical protein
MMPPTHLISLALKIACDIIFFHKPDNQGLLSYSLIMDSSEIFTITKECKSMLFIQGHIFSRSFAVSSPLQLSS